MKKYFKEESKKEILLSEYLKKDLDKFIFSEDVRKRRTEHLINILGDVPFEMDLYEEFIQEFQSFGGRYDVRCKPDTIKAIYEITRKYPYLTVRAIQEIWFIYIKDFFEEYELMKVFDEHIKLLGKEDRTFELFIEYADKKSEFHQQRYIEDSLQADELLEEYGEQFTSHIKSLIRRQHYTYEEIKKYLPSSELIKKDEKHISDLSAKTRIFFGCCEPVSYTMFDILLAEGKLDTYTKTPMYYISTGIKEEATFTKQEFLDSIQIERGKKLEKK